MDGPCKTAQIMVAQIMGDSSCQIREEVELL